MHARVTGVGGALFSDGVYAAAAGEIVPDRMASVLTELAASEDRVAKRQWLARDAALGLDIDDDDPRLFNLFFIDLRLGIGL